MAIIANGTAYGIEQREEAGCYANYGCANISLVVLIIFYGLRFITVAFTIVSIAFAFHRYMAAVNRYKQYSKPLRPV